MSTAAIPVHVALVDKTGEITPDELATVAGALNEQVLADFSPVWKVKASVGAYRKAPEGCWAVYVQKKLDQPGALGYHSDDKNNQPVSFCEFGDTWPVTVAHETMEMLADPYGNRMHTAELPDAVKAEYTKFGLSSKTAGVHYLLEVCDPCEETSYKVGGVALSDFLLPAWYRSAPSAKLAYSHAGGCGSPREVAAGGYVSFANDDGEWYQIFNEGGSLQVQDLGKFSDAHAKGFRSLREWTDFKAREYRS